VTTGNKKRKKKGKDGEEDEEMDDEEEEVDPELVKAKEKPFYSLLAENAVVQTSQAGSTSYGNAGLPDVDQPIPLSTGYQLPFAGGTGDSFTANHAFHHVDFPSGTANDYLYHNAQGQNGLGSVSPIPFPLLNQNTANPRSQTSIVPQNRTTIETLAAQLSPSLAMFTQSLGIESADTMANPGNTFVSTMPHHADPNFSSIHSPLLFNDGQRRGQPTSNASTHALDAIFSPLQGIANAAQFSPHGSSPDTIVQGATSGNMDNQQALVAEQEGIEEGTYTIILIYQPHQSNNVDRSNLQFRLPPLFDHFHQTLLNCCSSL
jgi:hypothetical protein